MEIQMKNVLVFSNPKDPITRIVQGWNKIDPENHQCLSVEKLLNEVEIFDKVENGKASIEWTLPNGKVIKNETDVRLINRVLGLETELFEEFHEEDRDYAYQEFMAYLTFALSSFREILGKPGPFGLCGNQLPLPVQWHLVQKENISVRVPRYILDPSCSLELGEESNSYVSGDLYSYYHWEPEANGNVGKFIYERPKGDPVLVQWVQGATEIQMMGVGEVPGNKRERLVSLTRQIAHVLEQDIAEFLYFVDCDQVTFGMASNLMRSSVHDATLERLCEKGLGRANAK
jgi:hypothetical protein